MTPYAKQMLAPRLKKSLGFGCFLAWIYCSFFSCGLVPVIFLLRSIERAWVYTGCAQVVTAVVVLAVVLRARGAVHGHFRRIAITGVGAACVGTVLIWTSFLNVEWYRALTVSGGLLTGVGMALLTVTWGDSLSRCEEESVEFIVPAGFVFSFALYFVLVAVKGPLFMVVDAILPAVAAYMAHRPHCAQEPDEAGEGDGASKQLRRLATMFVLYALLWFQFAFFRVLSSPTIPGDRFVHYLAPFTCASVLAAAAFVVCIRRSRFLNFTFMYRWSVPLMVISYGVLFVDSGGLYDEKSVAYTINFIAMFGVQLCMWSVAPKYVRRMGVSPVALFGGLSAAEGLGVALGLALSLPLVEHIEEAAGLSLLFMGVVLLVAMLVGFNPHWLFFRGVKRLNGMEERGVASASAAGGEDEVSSAMGEGSSELESLFERASLKLRDEYGLTERETEIAALLLSGRSRPYIRDELMISLNTVHAHVRNIYAKCGVHSQQEFMDFMRIEVR